MRAEFFGLRDDKISLQRQRQHQHVAASFSHGLFIILPFILFNMSIVNHYYHVPTAEMSFIRIYPYGLYCTSCEEKVGNSYTSLHAHVSQYHKNEEMVVSQLHRRVISMQEQLRLIPFLPSGKRIVKHVCRSCFRHYKTKRGFNEHLERTHCRGGCCLESFVTTDIGVDIPMSKFPVSYDQLIWRQQNSHWPTPPENFIPPFASGYMPVYDARRTQQLYPATGFYPAYNAMNPFVLPLPDSSQQQADNVKFLSGVANRPRNNLVSLLLPDTICHKNKERNYESPEEVRDIITSMSKTISATRKHKKYIPCAFYKNLFQGFKLLDPTVSDFDLELDIGADNKTKVSIRNVSNNASLLAAGQGLGNRVAEMLLTRLCSESRDGNYGNMVSIGYRDSKQGIEYKGTSDCRLETNKFVEEFGSYLNENMPEVQEDIERAELSKMGEAGRCKSFQTRSEKSRCGNTIHCSLDYAIENHYDPYDASLCAVLWVSQTGKPVGNWYFLLPDASIGGSTGIVVKLSHGTVISWHGNEIKHCSAIPRAEENNAIYGLFVGSTSRPKSMSN